jgi:quercetin dioxygenase-like cupin family protein
MSQTSQMGTGAVVVRPEEGVSVPWGPAGSIRIVAGAETTGGSFSICEVTEDPGSAAPLHVHHGEAEAFYVLDGELELTCGGESVTLRAGDFAYGPRGVAHSSVGVGARPARGLLLFSRPGFESFFVEASADLASLPRLGGKYELELREAPTH